MRISNYSNGKIYAIVDRNETVVYIGTTVSTLYRAWNNMKTILLRKPPFLKDPLLSYLYRNKKQIYRMILVEHYPCQLFFQLENRADKYVNIFDPIVNRIKKHQHKFKSYKSFQDSSLYKGSLRGTAASCVWPGAGPAQEVLLPSSSPSLPKCHQ